MMSITELKNHGQLQFFYWLLKDRLAVYSIYIPNDEIQEAIDNAILDVFANDEATNKKILDYITLKTNLPTKRTILTFMEKEITQLIYNLGNRKECLRNYFIWAVLGILFNVAPI